jgi:DNA-binding MarR family transcriptional regulator
MLKSIKRQFVEARNANCPEPLDLRALQQTPGFMIRVLQIQIFDDFFQYFSSIGISPAEYSSLITIRDNPSATQSEVANALRVRLPNLVKVLLKLKTKGLIKRTRSKTDKRAVKLNLTSNGEKAAVQALKMADAFNRQILSPFSKSEQREFLRMLTVLIDA